MDKKAWRHQIRAMRAATTIDQDGPVAALERFLSDAVEEGRRIVIYDAMPDEVDLGPLVDAHPAPGERFALTRTPEVGHELTIHPVDAPTERHRYGYRQPLLDGPVVADGDIGAVVVPGLGFDRFGARLGRGAGYYDRFLARLEPGVLRVGMTAGIVVERLPVEGHDVAMTHLATADGVFEVPIGGRPGAGLSSG